MSNPTPFPIDAPLESTFGDLRTIVARGDAAAVPDDAAVYVLTTDVGATRHGSRLIAVYVVDPSHPSYTPPPGGLVGGGLG